MLLQTRCLRHRTSAPAPVCRALYAVRHVCLRQAHNTASANASSRLQPLRAAKSDTNEGDEEDVFAPCNPAFVVADNGSNPHYSQIAIDVSDYPGLLRVITWVMNGMGCRVHNAVLKSSEDGQASDVFWVTNLRGCKLSDADLADVAERLEEFVSYCAPPNAGGEFTEYACGDIRISNLTHTKWTEVTITANIFSPGLLFEMSSIFHGQGLVICEGIVRGGSESPIPQEMLSGMAESASPEPPHGKRVMRFWIKEAKSGSKLDYADVSALLYTLRVVLGDGGLPTRPPNSELNSLVCECSESDVEAAAAGVLAVRGAGVAKGRVAML